MISELGVVAAEVAKEAGAEAAKETVKEVGKDAVKKSAVDISKRVDVTKQVAETASNKIDISKRIPADTAKEVASKDIAETVKDYIKDLKAKSEVSDTISEKALDVSKMEFRASEKVSEMREQFDDNKAKLRSEWEKATGKEWPKYKEDVYNENGVKIRKAGANYDAHHIQPLQWGGENIASNLTPLDLSKHKEIHSSTGSCTKLLEKLEGASKV